MKKLQKILLTLCLFVIYCFVSACGKAPVTADSPAQEATPPEYYRIVVASDVHYPSKTTKEKNSQLRQQKIDNKIKTAGDISSWKDVNLVVFTGDLVQLTGSQADYQQAKLLADKITTQKVFLTGNHEFMYEDVLSDKGKLLRGTKQERADKLKLFKKTLGVKQLYFSQNLGKYLLVFLSPDMDNATFLTEMSKQELAWLRDTLANNKEKPTICFFHGPLAGTLDNYSNSVNKPNFIAQPREELDAILEANPQIKLWVSGHTHTSPMVPCFASKINYYEETKILDVHNPSWDGKQIWTNSLYLYPDKIVIKTYDHAKGDFMPQLTREVPVQTESQATAKAA